MSIGTGTSLLPKVNIAVPVFFRLDEPLRSAGKPPCHLESNCLAPTEVNNDDRPRKIELSRTVDQQQPELAFNWEHRPYLADTTSH